MKKSTILLLVLVYIVSFFMIGLLGHSIRNYNPVYLPESIELVDPDNKTAMSKDTKDPETGELLYDYYFVYVGYSDGMSLRIKAIVKPDNCSYPDVSYVPDATNESYNLDTHETDNNIEKGFAKITLNEHLDAGSVLTVTITVTSTNPGTKIKLNVGLTFVGA